MAASQDPASSLLRLQANLDRLLGDPTLGLSGFGSGNARVFPPVNVFADSEGFLVHAEVPGAKPDQIEVVAEPRRLVISGELTRDEDDKGSYHRRERQYGRFSRMLALPDELDTDAATASCARGVLTVRIPKRPEHKPRRVDIERA